MREKNSRPRSTKIVYFFKSGDEKFTGIRLPVNTRRYKDFGGVLDDLTPRIPGLPRGVRTVTTPRGKDKVTELDKLVHMGSYVCSDRIQAKRIAGVNLPKIVGIKYPESALYSNPPPKRVKRKKKKRKRKKVIGADQIKLPELENGPSSSSTIGRLAQGSLVALQQGTAFLNTTNREEEQENEQSDSQEKISQRDQEETDGSQDGGVWMGPRKGAGAEGGGQGDSGGGPNEPHGDPTVDHASSNERDHVISSEGNTTMEKGSVGEKSQTDESKSLPPLNGDKLTHFQRRRIASKQVDPEKFTWSDSSDEDKNNTKEQKIGLYERDFVASGDTQKRDGPENNEKSEKVISTGTYESIALTFQPIQSAGKQPQAKNWNPITGDVIDGTSNRSEQ